MLDVAGHAGLHLVAGGDVGVDLDETNVGEEVSALDRVAVVVQDRIDLGTVVTSVRGCCSHISRLSFHGPDFEQ